MTYLFAMAHSVTLSGSSLSSASAARHSISRDVSSAVAMSARVNRIVGSSMQRPAEGLPVGQIGGGLVEGGLRAAQRARRDVEPATVEAVHRDTETGAFAVGSAEHRVRGHPDALAGSPGRWAGRSSPSSPRWRRNSAPGVSFSTMNAEMPRGPSAPVRRHHHVDVGDSRAGDELLDAVEHVVIAVANRLGAQRRRIRSGTRLGQAVAGDERPSTPAAEPRSCVARRCRRCRSSTRTCCGSR